MDALAEFIGFSDARAVHAHMEAAERAALKACSVYALLRTQYAVRNGLPPEAFRGFAFEALRGCPRMAGIVRQALKRTR